MFFWGGRSFGETKIVYIMDTLDGIQYSLYIGAFREFNAGTSIRAILATLVVVSENEEHSPFAAKGSFQFYFKN